LENMIPRIGIKKINSSLDILNGDSPALGKHDPTNRN